MIQRIKYHTYSMVQQIKYHTYSMIQLSPLLSVGILMINFTNVDQHKSYLAGRRASAPKWLPPNNSHPNPQRKSISTALLLSQPAIVVPMLA